MTLTPLNKALITSNLLLVGIAIAAAKYETPAHMRRDALNALSGIQRTERLPQDNLVYREIRDALAEELKRPVEIDWAGIEWARVGVMVRSHATTVEGKRYVVQMLIDLVGEDQLVQRSRSEVIDVTDQLNGKGL